MTVLPIDIKTNDKHIIKVLEWFPSDSQASCIIQVLHGLGEHAGRYHRFAEACNQQGIAVVSHNHRGHGDLEGFGHYADKNGWDKVIADVLAVQQWIAESHPKKPVILFGHSMGSYIAQCFVMRHGGINVGLVLSGSTFASRIQLRAGNIAARVLAITTGKRTTNDSLNWAGLGRLNNAFEPTRTDCDWLSRDEREVDSYIADPLCGGAYSNQLWADLTGGMLEVTSRKSIASINLNLPILIVGGSDDPVGGQKGLTDLASVYHRTGHENVTLKIFRGGRHEMLNETNRNEVTIDIINWLNQHSSM